MSTDHKAPAESQHLHRARPTGAPGAEPERDSSPTWAVAIGRALGTVVVTVHGELTATTATSLAEVLRDLIDDQGNLSVVVDARDLTVTCGDGVTAFVVAAEWARRHGGTLSLAHASERLRAALVDDGAHEIVRFIDTTPTQRH